MLNGLDLFSGIGGITLALSEWVRPVAYCEVEPYAAGVLFSRMADGSLPRAPIFPDIRKLSAEILPSIDIIYGGFPCQDVSTAGLRKGLDGERTGLFREAIRLIRECKPKFVFLENVPGIRRYVPSVRGELEALGFDCRDGFLSAAEVGANHIRNRWWLLAHANGDRCGQLYEGKPQRKQGREDSSDIVDDGAQEFMADSECLRELQPQGGQKDKRRWSGNGSKDVVDAGRKRLQRCVPATRPVHAGANGSSWWDSEPDVGRVVNGLRRWLDDCKQRGEEIYAHESCITKASAAGVSNSREVLLLWRHREFTAPSSEHRRCRICGDLMSAVPQGGTPTVWDVGQWSEESKGMRHLREGVYALYLLSKYDMQPGMQIGAWQTKCIQTVENRTARIKSLGNSVVPQCAKEAFKRLIGLP